MLFMANNVMEDNTMIDICSYNDSKSYFERELRKKEIALQTAQNRSGHTETELDAIRKKISYTKCAINALTHMTVREVKHG